jgi:hypothetical protein
MPDEKEGNELGIRSEKRSSLEEIFQFTSYALISGREKMSPVRIQMLNRAS